VKVAKNDLQRTLDLLVLKTLSQMGSLHGYGIVLHIQRASDELLQVEEGSLYTASHRMGQSGRISSAQIAAAVLLLSLCIASMLVPAARASAAVPAVILKQE
jgi:hypothetical protein